MALRLGELSIILTIKKEGVTRGLAEARTEVKAGGQAMERESDASGRRMGDALGRSGLRGAEKFVRDAAGRLHTGRSRFAAEGDAMGRAAGDAARGGMSFLEGAMSAVSSAARWLSQGVGSASGAVSSLGAAGGPAGAILSTLGPWILGIAAASAFAVPAVYALAGALASLPALAVGLGAGLGVLGLGFMGLADHFGKAASGGRSAGKQIVDTAWQIAQAERRVRDANREVLASTKALSEARETAAKRIRDLNSSLAQAHLDERAAVDAVADAEADLRAARTPEEVKDRQLALDQANQTLKDTRTRISDLTEEQRKNTREGVQGSDEVQSALERRRKALEGLADAQHALKEAEKPPPGGGGGGGGAVKQLTKLAPAAAYLVSVLKSLKPAWEDLRLDVQQRLFAGVGGEIRSLAAAWLPQLHRSLGGMATTFNGLFKTFSKSAKNPEFIKNIGKGIESVRRLIDKVGGAVAGPFTKAFGQLAGAAGPFLDKFGDKLTGLVTSFSKWIDKAEKSGQLKQFFKDAAKYLGQIWDFLGDLGGLAKDFFSIWTDTGNAQAGQGLFDTIRNGIRDLRVWLSDPSNRQQMKEFVNAFLWLGTVAANILGWVVGTFIPGFYKAIWGVAHFLAGIIARVRKGKDEIIDKWNSLIGWFGKLPGRMSRATRGLFDGIKNAFRSAINWMIDRWNDFHLTLGGGSVLGIAIPSVTLDTPNIPHLAGGGVVKARPGGRLAVVGEGGQDEAVAPLSKLAAMLRGIGGRTVLEIRSGGNRLDDLLVEVLREAVQDRGGNVQVVLGR